jgi:hypothetical protein
VNGAREAIAEGFRLGGDEQALTQISDEIVRAEGAAEQTRLQDVRDRMATRKVEAARQIATRDVREAVVFLENDDSGHPAIAAALLTLRDEAVRQDQAAREQAERERAQQAEAERRAREEAERRTREKQEQEKQKQEREEREKQERGDRSFELGVVSEIERPHPAASEATLDFIPPDATGSHGSAPSIRGRSLTTLRTGR